MKQTTRCWTQRSVKRVFDVTAVLIGLVLLLPVLLTVGLVILAIDGWPVLFGQTRVGRGGKPFRIWKFRTMRCAAAGSLITAAGDERVTKTGRWLRKYKLDELPQLFNVLWGEMSLVGPRPEIPHYVQLRTPIWEAVLQAPPGITDLASLLYRHEEELLRTAHDTNLFYRERILPAKLLLNLEYLRSRSLVKDVRLIWLTVRYSLCPAGFDPERIRRSFTTGAVNESRFYSISSAVDR